MVKHEKHDTIKDDEFNCNALYFITVYFIK